MGNIIILHVLLMVVKTTSAQWDMLTNFGNYQSDNYNTQNGTEDSTFGCITASTLIASALAAVIIIIILLGILCVWKFCVPARSQPDKEKLEESPPAYELPPSYEECV
ncbi:hypothetical protein Ocin01_07012 [Orchesella cincta]|uniref:Uncharacterized protein n=1 Tax=Orchesella cincta TaxID=48709 RepID=A0A1D2N3M5_ORCCI|nr:hypothetical protein Ocin01_07012 [Orchesella cincta]